MDFFYNILSVLIIVLFLLVPVVAQYLNKKAQERRRALAAAQPKPARSTSPALAEKQQEERHFLERERKVPLYQEQEKPGEKLMAPEILTIVEELDSSLPAEKMGEGFERLGKLPLLKQAVVWREILGPPRAVSDWLEG